MTAEHRYPIIEARLLVRIGLDGDTIYGHTGIGNFQYAGNVYLGFGEILVLEEIANTATLQSNPFRLTLSRTTDEITAAALAANLRDRDIEVGLYLGKAGAGAYQTLKLGRISSATLSADRIEVEAYTPMADLARTKNIATHLTREHQQQYVAADDRCCNFVSDHAISHIPFP